MPFFRRSIRIRRSPWNRGDFLKFSGARVFALQNIPIALFRGKCDHRRAGRPLRNAEIFGHDGGFCRDFPFPEILHRDIIFLFSFACQHDIMLFQLPFIEQNALNPRGLFQLRRLLLLIEIAEDFCSKTRGVSSPRDALWKRMGGIRLIKAHPAADNILAVIGDNPGIFVVGSIIIGAGSGFGRKLHIKLRKRTLCRAILHSGFQHRAHEKSALGRENGVLLLIFLIDDISISIHNFRNCRGCAVITA